MPKELESCVQGVIKSGKTESEAYAICGSKTGWVRKSGGGWKNKKTGEIYEKIKDTKSGLEIQFESFDTSYNIQKIEKGNPDFYYTDINGKIYRIFVEKVNHDGIHLHIGFERKIQSKWTTEGITNDLSTKEIMGLFGTVIKLVKSMRFNSITFGSHDVKKSRIYQSIFNKMIHEFNLKNPYVSYDDYSVSIYTDEPYTGDFKYKWKKDKNMFENFYDMFIEGSQQTLNWLRDTKGIRKEIQRLKKIANKNPEDEQDILNAIKYLEDKLKG